MEQFDHIYEENWYRVYSYAYNIMRDKQVAEDITQDIFLDLWKRFDSVPDGHQYYLLAAAKYQCFKRLRKTKYSEIQLENIEYAFSQLEDQGESQYLQKEELLKQLESTAKQILPNKCYQVFQLRYHNEMSYKEIANELRISINTVDSHLKKALQLLRDSDLNADTLLMILLCMSIFSC